MDQDSASVEDREVVRAPRVNALTLPQVCMNVSVSMLTWHFVSLPCGVARAQGANAQAQEKAQCAAGADWRCVRVLQHVGGTVTVVGRVKGARNQQFVHLGMRPFVCMLLATSSTNACSTNPSGRLQP